MALRGPSWLQAQPELPYTPVTSYAGSDLLLQLTFLNSSSVPTEPTSITYELDSLDSSQNVIPSTSLTPTGSTQILQLPGSSMQLTRQLYGREGMQLWVSAVIPDTNASTGSIKVNQVVYIDLIQIATPPQ